MDVDTTKWTGEGSFTPLLVEALKGVDGIEYLRLEDAPASRTEAGYAFIANEIYLRVRTQRARVPGTRLGVIPWPRRVDVPVLTLADVGRRLAAAEGVGEPDYADEGMLQYLRTERLVAPYQTRGIKVVEMVRVYMAGSD
jgi:hypothetical protein